MLDVESAPPFAGPSPWRTIWFSPRATIRRVIDAGARPTWVPVVALAALHQTILSLQPDPSDGTLSVARSTMPVIIGVLQLVFGVLVGPFLLAFVGGWLGGEADPSDIRESVAWSYVPHAVATVWWIPVFVAYQGRLVPPDIGSRIDLLLIAMTTIVIVFGALLWSFVLQVITLAEVQRFSIGRALLSMIILMLPLILLGVVGS